MRTSSSSSSGSTSSSTSSSPWSSCSTGWSTRRWSASPYRDGLLWLVFPLVWIVVTLVRGAADGWYPYPFLDPANGGYGTVAVVVIAITIGFLVLAAVTAAIGDRLGRRATSAGPGPT